MLFQLQDFFEEWQAVRGSLATARMRADHEIFAIEEQWDGLLLHFRGFLEVELRERAQEDRIRKQLAEFVFHSVGVESRGE